MARIEKAQALVTDGGPDRHWLIWHDLEDERRALEKQFPEAKTVYGSQDLEVREDLIMGFSRGSIGCWRRNRSSRERVQFPTALCGRDLSRGGI